jgi:hypothetical protein
LTEREGDRTIDPERSNKPTKTANYDAFVYFYSHPRMQRMEIDEQDIREFTEIWKREFKEDLSPDEARSSATRLLELFWLLAQPLSSEKRQPPQQPPIR